MSEHLISDEKLQELNAAFKENTKLVFGETIANPALTVLDIELFAKVASSNNSSFMTGVFVRVLFIRLIRFHSDNNSEEEFHISKSFAIYFIGDYMKDIFIYLNLIIEI